MDPENAKKYFNINPDCFVIAGAKRGAVYDLAKGDVYSIDPMSLRILKACEANRPIADIVSEVQEVPPEEVHSYLDNLEKENIGKLSGEPYDGEKIDVGGRCDTLDYMWLELREDCNLTCRHCYCMCKPKTGVTNRLRHEEWMRLLDEGIGVGCKTMQFIGGEPFLYGDKLFDLAQHAREAGYESIEVFSNLTFLKDWWIDKIVELKMKVACSIFSKRPGIHDLVTMVPGSFEKTIKNVRLLKERGVQPRFALTIMKHNQDYLDETLEFLHSMGNPRPGYDVVRPSGRGNDREIIPEKISKKRAYLTRPDFLHTDRKKFMKRFHGNGCWAGKLAVSSIGKVNPCIMQRDNQAGDVRKQSLEEIIAGPLRKYWDLSYDKIEVCKDCEYKYACSDCRPVTVGTTGELTAKSLHCCYDPYRGEWGEVETVRLARVTE